MQKKNITVAYAVAVFAYLYAGTVVRSPFYGTGNPILAYLVTSAALLAYAVAAVTLFSRRSDIGTREPAGLISCVVAALACVSAGAFAEEYVGSLGGFSAAYGTPFAAVCAAAAMLFCGVYAASRGRLCVAGFSRLIFWLFVVWTAAGFFAFFSTGRVFMPESPFVNLAKTNWTALAGETAYVCLDLTFFIVVLTDRESETVRAVAPRSFLYGTLAFVLLSGLNLMKNLLLFGEDLAAASGSPDLAAIRLVPLFDLPEISVLVNTFACALKTAVYACAALFVLKNALGERYRSYPACLAAFVLAGGSFAVLYGLRGGGNLPDAAENTILFGLILAALLCFVLYSVPIKRPKKTE